MLCHRELDTEGVSTACFLFMKSVINLDVGEVVGWVQQKKSFLLQVCNGEVSLLDC